MGVFDFLKRKKEEEILPEEPEAEEVKPLELPSARPLPPQPPTPQLPKYPSYTYPQQPVREESGDKTLELIATKLEVINAKLDRIIDLLTRRY